MRDFTPPPPLTPQRIRAVMHRHPAVARSVRELDRSGVLGPPPTPDFAAGETEADVLAATLRPFLGDDADVERDYRRIRDLLSILERGTLDEEIARAEARLMAPDRDVDLRVWLDQLRRIPPYEVQAVLDSLDALEGELATAVDAVRRRHFAEEARE